MKSYDDIAHRLALRHPFEKGSVWIAGAGAGDIGLLTLHALHGLRHADVILYDALVNQEILSLVQETAEFIFVGKRQGAHCAPTQEDINQCLITEARQHKRILRLKGGDPLVFARTGEEMDALAQANIPMRLIPGVSSVTAALAYTGIPLTHRAVNSSVMMLTGHDKKGSLPQEFDWRIIARSSPVLIFFMALSKLEHICQELLTHGRHKDEPMAVISHATYDKQKIVTATLATLAAKVKQATLTPPALVILGKNLDFKHEVIPQVPIAQEVPQGFHLSHHFLLRDGQKQPFS